MAANSKYSGLCEACDHDATCTLKRSTQLEIIHCEHFFTQPVVNKQMPVQEEMELVGDQDIPDLRVGK